MAKLLVVGDLGWDVFPGFTQLGGWAGTFAYCSHLLGEKVLLASSVGRDPDGTSATEGLAQSGIDTRLIQVDCDVPTQRCAVGPFSDGTRCVELPRRAACDFILKKPELVAEALHTEAFYFNSRGLRLSGTRTCISDLLETMPKSCTVFDARDPRMLPPNSLFEHCMRHSRILHFTVEDTAAMCELLGLPELEPGLLCAAVVERFRLKACLASSPTLGAYGASEEAGELYHPAEKAALYPAAGWHAAFLSGVLSRHITGESLLESCQFGLQYAGLLTARREGALQWTVQEVERALQC
jgi:sugar/nucleoside kinase (ribokinase family)